MFLRLQNKEKQGACHPEGTGLSSTCFTFSPQTHAVCQKCSMKALALRSTAVCKSPTQPTLHIHGKAAKIPCNESIWKCLTWIPVCTNTIFHREIWKHLQPMTLLQYAMSHHVKSNPCL